MSKQTDDYLNKLIDEGIVDKAKCKYAKFIIKDAKKTLDGMIKMASDNCRKTWGHRPKALNHCLKMAKSSHAVKSQQQFLERQRKIRDSVCYGKKVSESKNLIVENFLQSLYTDKRVDAKEWQGPNIPYGDDSNRPNLIRKCMTLESDKMKINCLRKLRDQVAMNPFYQARLDRFVDAVTGIYEPTDKPGTIPGNEFKSSVVGEELK